MQDLQKFPARPLTPDERKVFAAWLARAGDVAFAYVSRRTADDPALLHRIIIGVGPGNQPSHIVHAPCPRDIWMVFALGRRTRIGRYLSLRAALNSIRPALVDGESMAID